MDVNGKAAIVTGGASGMGAATARALGAAGARVAIFDINEPAMKETAAAIGGLALICDVSDGVATEAAFAQARDQHGAAQILVNCAGVGVLGPTVGADGPLPLQDFERVIAINLTGTFNTIRLAAADMMALEPVEDGSRGVIINTASGAGHEGGQGQPAYVASKGGVISLTLSLAREFGDASIRVLTISPGAMDTPMLRAGPSEISDVLTVLQPFPDRLGQPEEFAQLVMHLCKNPFMNGEVIRLDGGARIPYPFGIAASAPE